MRLRAVASTLLLLTLGFLALEMATYPDSALSSTIYHTYPPVSQLESGAATLFLVSNSSTPPLDNRTHSELLKGQTGFQNVLDLLYANIANPQILEPRVSGMRIVNLHANIFDSCPQGEVTSRGFQLEFLIGATAYPVPICDFQAENLPVLVYNFDMGVARNFAFVFGVVSLGPLVDLVRLGRKQAKPEGSDGLHDISAVHSDEAREHVSWLS